MRHRVCLRALGQADLVGADLAGVRSPWCAMIQVPVAGILEGVERLAGLPDGGEAAEPEQVFLERADEPLDAALAFGLEIRDAA